MGRYPLQSACWTIRRSSSLACGRAGKIPRRRTVAYLYDHHRRTKRRNTTEEKFAVGKLQAFGQRTLQLGSPSGGVNFFNAICRLLMYEGSLSTRLSDLLISTDSFVCAESVSAGVGLRSAFSVSIDPLQHVNIMVLSTAIIWSSRQVGCTRSENALK